MSKDQIIQSELVDIVLQYLICIDVQQIDEEGKLVKFNKDKAKNQERQSVSVVKAELYMERESCSFVIDHRFEKNAQLINSQKKGTSELSGGSNFNPTRSRANSN